MNYVAVFMIGWSVGVLTLFAVEWWIGVYW